MSEITTGITIGGAGGAIAGITVWIIQYLYTQITKLNHKWRIYNWLIKNTENTNSMKFRSIEQLQVGIISLKTEYNIYAVFIKRYIYQRVKKKIFGVYTKEENVRIFINSTIAQNMSG